MLYDSILPTVDELRIRAGARIQDVTDIGWIPDSAFSAIIADGAKALDNVVRSRILELERAGIDPMGLCDTVNVVITTLSDDASAYPGLRAGYFAYTLDPIYFPYASLLQDTAGNNYTLDRSLGRTVHLSPFARHRFYFRGQDLIIYAGGETNAANIVPMYIELATVENLVSSLVGAEYNTVIQGIIEEAVRMVERNIREAARLQQSNDFD